MRRISKDIVDGTFYSQMDSPVGMLIFLATEEGLSAVLWEEEVEGEENRTELDALERRDRHPILVATREQLAEYFAGKRTTFDIPLVFRGTPFQREVWKRLLEIPYGKTVCYQDQARKVGGINKVRAVGAANGKNPISIIVPCHRVVGKDGSLTGFGGGLDRKRLLLELEGGRSEAALPGLY